MLHPLREASALPRGLRASLIFDRLAEAVPDPTPSYPLLSPYELLVVVTVSAQASDSVVLRATSPLFAVANTPRAMLDLEQDRLEAYLRPIGLQRTKAKAVKDTARALLARFEGTVPRRRAELESLPGVGPKTASIVLHRLGIEATIAVDTHVLRVAHRLDLARARKPRDVERELISIVPPQRRMHAHDWLVRHGKTTCHARSPACPSCTVSDLCPSLLGVAG